MFGNTVCRRKRNVFREGFSVSQIFTFILIDYSLKKKHIYIKGYYYWFGTRQYKIGNICLLDTDLLIMEFTPENLEKAVAHFYQDLNSQSNLTQLNSWLTVAQSSAQAWAFSWHLLDKTKVCTVLSFQFPVFENLALVFVFFNVMITFG